MAGRGLPQRKVRTLGSVLSDLPEPLWAPPLPFDPPTEVRPTPPLTAPHPSPADRRNPLPGSLPLPLCGPLTHHQQVGGLGQERGRPWGSLREAEQDRVQWLLQPGGPLWRKVAAGVGIAGHPGGPTLGPTGLRPAPHCLASGGRQA